MPLFFQQHLNNTTQAAIWKIEEEEAFFLAHVPLQRTITHPHKRLQHLAGRYLLKFLVPHFPVELIRIADTRKPFLEDELFHFSISHCGDYAAVVVSSHNRVGVDIEIVSDIIQRVQHKFVSEEEMAVMNSEWSSDRDGIPPLAMRSRLTLLWSCKEAVFKWYGSGMVDFKKQMQVINVETHDAKLFQTTMLVKKNKDRYLGLYSCFFDNLCLSYVVT